MMRIGLLLAAAVVFAVAWAEPPGGPPPVEAATPPPLTPHGASPAADDSLRAAPPLALPTLDGDTLRLSDLHGQVVLLNFWATWCPPCRVETPELVALYEALRHDGLTVVGVAMDRAGAPVVAPFVDAYDISYPIVLGDAAAAEAFGEVYGLPTTFVIDRDGRVVHRLVGRLRTSDVRPLLRRLLGA